MTNPNARELENHKLSGELKGQRAISISEDYRITFIEVEENALVIETTDEPDFFLSFFPTLKDLQASAILSKIAFITLVMECKSM